MIENPPLSVADTIQDLMKQVGVLRRRVEPDAAEEDVSTWRLLMVASTALDGAWSAALSTEEYQHEIRDAAI